MVLRLIPSIKEPLSFAAFLLAIFYLGFPSCLEAQSRSPIQISTSLVLSRQGANVVKPSEEWLGIYLSKKKVGYSSSVTSPTLYHGKPAIREVGAGVTKLTVLGTSVEEEENTETISDLDHRPLFQSFDVKSNGSAIHVVAKFDYATKRIECVIGSGADASKKTVEIPDGADLAADSNTVSHGKTITVGQKFSFYYLDPLSVELKQADVEVTGKSTIKDDSGKLVAVFTAKSNLATGQMISWANEKGTLYRGEVSLGPISIIMVRESKEHALNKGYLTPSLDVGKPGSSDTPVPPADFAVATAIVPDKPIEDARKLRSLKVLIAGVPEKKLLLSDARQKVTDVRSGKSGGFSATFSLHDDAFDFSSSILLPIKSEDLKPYLSKAAYLDIENENIKQTAATIRGHEENAYKVAVAIRDWVNVEMTPDPSIGVIRSATDVFGRRRGVCRDYATLYTAIARAAGLPTRLCAGIVYSQGRFYYHAWAESYVGKWVAFDPTLYQPSIGAEYVDATHIKFAQGDVTGMLNVVSIVGRLKIKVLEQAQ